MAIMDREFTPCQRQTGCAFRLGTNYPLNFKTWNMAHCAWKKKMPAGSRETYRTRDENRSSGCPAKGCR